MPRPSLVERLDKFMDTWISNPAAQLDFVRLIDEVRHAPSSDHRDHPLLTWIDEQKRGLRSIGIR